VSTGGLYPPSGFLAFISRSSVSGSTWQLVRTTSNPWRSTRPLVPEVEEELWKLVERAARNAGLDSVPRYA